METMETAQLCRVLVQCPRRRAAGSACLPGEGAEVPGAPLPGAACTGQERAAAAGAPGRAPGRQHVWHTKVVLETVKIRGGGLHTWLSVVPPVPRCGPPTRAICEAAGSGSIHSPSALRQRRAHPVPWPQPRGELLSVSAKDSPSERTASLSRAECDGMGALPPPALPVSAGSSHHEELQQKAGSD